MIVQHSREKYVWLGALTLQPGFYVLAADQLHSGHLSKATYRSVRHTQRLTCTAAHSSRDVLPALYGGSKRAEQGYRARVQSKGTEQACRAKVQSKGAEQGYRARVQSKGAEQGYRARVQSKGAEQGYRARVQSKGVQSKGAQQGCRARVCRARVQSKGAQSKRAEQGYIARVCRQEAATNLCRRCEHAAPGRAR